MRCHTLPAAFASSRVRPARLETPANHPVPGAEIPVGGEREDWERLGGRNPPCQHIEGCKPVM